jgi:aconitate hydratase
MAGMPFQFKMPKVVNVVLKGRLRLWVSAKDVILEILRRLSVKGGVNKIFEYTGPALAHLSVPQRSTIANMGAEMGATTSIFPSDDITRSYFKAQGREADYVAISPDEGAFYDEIMEIDLDTLEPLVAKPHMPDNVVPAADLKDLEIQQIFIGSCTNGSYADLVRVANILKNKMVHPDVQVIMAPGSRQVFEMLARNGYLADLISSGVRILECACGPCTGSNQVPSTGGVSLRSNNRNYEGRSGALNAFVYLASAETCAASAVTGKLTDAREFADVLDIAMPESFIIDDRMIIAPPADGSDVEIIRGPNIKDLPPFDPLEDYIETEISIKVGDNITTDHIIPVTPETVKYRSNIPAIAQFLFQRLDSTFPTRVQAYGSGMILAGRNYGQGSSREHAVIAPRFLNIKLVLAKSFARIHHRNLINFGVLPIVFLNENDYELNEPGDIISIHNVTESVRKNCFVVRNHTQNKSFEARHQLTGHQIEVLLAGGLLRYATQKNDLTL